MTNQVPQILADLRVLTLAHRAAADAWVKRSGLTRQQGFTLGYIQEHQDRGVIAREVAEASGTKPASVTSMLQGLQQLGYITRIPSAEDSRVKLLRVTPEGSAVIAGFDEEMEAAQDALFRGLGPDEQRQLADLLGRAVAALPEEHRSLRALRPPRRRA